MTETPMVSVIMNCFDGETYLPEALDSVLAQTFEDWEIVFWDNQSTDRSAEIFKSYADPRFRYWYAPDHTLLYEARNYGGCPRNWRSSYPFFLTPRLALPAPISGSRAY